MKLKISRIMLESSRIFRAKADIRYYLNGACFMPGGKLAATDGHRLFIGSHENELTENVIVSIEKSPVKKYDHAICDTETGLVEFFDFLEHRVGVALCQLVDGRYPDVERIMPKETNAVDRIGFNAGYLADVEKCAKLFNPKFSCVKFELNGNDKAAVATVNSPTGETAKIIVMPMRIE